MCLSISSLILSKIVFPSNTGLSKAPDIAVNKQDSLLPKKIFKGFTQNIVFLSSDIYSNFCTLIHPKF